MLSLQTCEMFRGDPFEPHCAMHRGELRNDRAPKASLPQFSRTLPGRGEGRFNMSIVNRCVVKKER